jgi:hypothetical protein
MALLVLAVLAVLLAGLAAFAFIRPWIGLVVLLAMLPFNGFLSDVIEPTLRLSSNASTMMSAWHDALAVGIIAAAAWAWIPSRRLRPTSFEAATGLVLVLGAISLAVAPNLVSGLYAYRTLYEPICLAVAIVALVRERGLPGWVVPTAATAVVLSAVVTALYSFWQVYVGGYGYLQTFQVRGGHLPTAYLSAFIYQPRAFGTFHSPNEFGALVAFAIILALSPAIVRLTPTARAWAIAVMAFAQFLSFSRSSWVALSLAAVILVVLLPVTRSGLDYLRSELAKRRTWLRFGVPLATLTLLTSIVIAGTGFSTFIQGTITGRDPSSVQHASDLSRLLPGVTVDQNGGSSEGSSGQSGLFGLGLGAAGAKSTRFESGSAGPSATSEVWYIDYLLQTGYVGLLALVVLFGVVGRELWRRRRDSLSRAALGIGAGLLAGAVFIPVLDEPALAIPVWAIIGLALARPPGGDSALTGTVASLDGVTGSSQATA